MIAQSLGRGQANEKHHHEGCRCDNRPDARDDRTDEARGQQEGSVIAKQLIPELHTVKELAELK